MTTLVVSQEYFDNVKLPLFQSFPYLSTRLVSVFYHITLYSKSIGNHRLIELAEFQAEANGLPACFVIGEQECVYFNPKSKPYFSRKPPLGGKIAFEKLQPPNNDFELSELVGRRGELIVFAEKANRGNYFLLGDPGKGGEKASAREIEGLSGRQEGGIPVGLSKCEVCGDYKGRCLDPSERFQGLVMTVSCLCENHNRGSWCGMLLHSHKLNSNYYENATDTIWFVPGFSCLSHKCDIIFGTVN